MEFDNKTIVLGLFLAGLLYIHYRCEKAKQKNMNDQISIKTMEGFRLPFRCDSHGDYYEWNGIPYDPFET